MYLYFSITMRKTYGFQNNYVLDNNEFAGRTKDSTLRINWGDLWKLVFMKATTLQASRKQESVQVHISLTIRAVVSSHLILPQENPTVCLLREKEKGATEDETVGWHHWFNGHELEQTPGDGEGQGSLVCCSHGVAKSQTQLGDWTTTEKGYGFWMNFVKGRIVIDFCF